MIFDKFKCMITHIQYVQNDSIIKKDQLFKLYNCTLLFDDLHFFNKKNEKEIHLGNNTPKINISKKYTYKCIL